MLGTRKRLISSCGHAEMDGEQDLNFYFLDPVATMDRFIGQPKFAGKTYMQYERQESEERPAKRAFGRANGGLIFQEAQLVDLHSVPMLHLFYADKSFSGGHRSTYPCYRKQCTLPVILCIFCIFVLNYINSIKNILGIICIILCMWPVVTVMILQKAA